MYFSSLINSPFILILILSFMTLVKDVIGAIKDLSTNEKIAKYKQFLLHRDSVHASTVQRIVHDAAVPLHEKCALRNDLQGKCVYTDLDAVYDAWSVLTGVVRPTFDVNQFFL